jgi:hypothetical protein
VLDVLFAEELLRIAQYPLSGFVMDLDIGEQPTVGLAVLKGSDAFR